MSEQREGIAYQTACDWERFRPTALEEVLAEWRFLKWDTSAPYHGQNNDEQWFRDNPDRQYRIRRTNCLEIEYRTDFQPMWNVPGQQMLFLIVARTDAAPARTLFWTRRADFLLFNDAEIAELLEYLAAYRPEGAVPQ